MAINDYVPKFDGISEFVPQMYQAINETARNTGQIRKATADTTAQGWAALQKAFTDFGEQNLQSRGLDLKAKDLAGTEAYRKEDTRLRGDANAFNREKLAAEQAGEEKNRASRERIAKTGQTHYSYSNADKNQPEVDPELNLLFNYLGRPVKGALVIDPASDIPRMDWGAYSKTVPMEQARNDFELAMNKAGVKDEGKRKAYRQSFEYWYKTGAPAEQPGEGKAAPNALRPNPNDQMDRQAAAVQAEIDRTKVPFGATPAEKRQIQEKLDGLAARLKELQPRASVSAFD